MALSRTLKGTTDFANTTEGGSHDGTFDVGTVTLDAILFVTAYGSLGLSGSSPSWTAPTKSSGAATIGTVVEVSSANTGGDYPSVVTVWRMPITAGGTLVLSVGDTGNSFGAHYTAIEYTGHDSGTPIAGAITATGTTSLSNGTLGATPVSADETLQFVNYDTDATTGKGMTAGTDFTELYDVGNSDDYVQASVSYRASSTSTTVVFNTQDGTPTVYKSAGVAFIVKNGSGITGSGTPSLAALTSSGTGTHPTAPAAISNLAGTAGDTQVVLTWTAPDDGGSSITDYIVQYRQA